MLSPGSKGFTYTRAVVRAWMRSAALLAVKPDEYRTSWGGSAGGDKRKGKYVKLGQKRVKAVSTCTSPVGAGWRREIPRTVASGGPSNETRIDFRISPTGFDGVRSACFARTPVQARIRFAMRLKDATSAHALAERA